MLTRYKLILSFAIVLITASASADSLVYVVTENNQFGTVNVGTGAFHQIAGITPDGGGAAGLVPGAGGSLLTLDFSGNLDRINPATGAITVIGATGLGGNGNTIAEVGGIVYATDFQNDLYTVNPVSGAATLIGTLGLPASPPVFSVNPDGSTNLLDESLFGSGGNLYATFDAWAVGTDGFTTTLQVPPDLWEIDPTDGDATLIGPTGFRILASADVDGTIYGFQGFPSSANPLPNPLVELVSIDPLNGDTSLIAPLDPSVGPLFGISPVPEVPEPASLALVGTGLVALAARFRRRHTKTNSELVDEARIRALHQ